MSQQRGNPRGRGGDQRGGNRGRGAGDRGRGGFQSRGRGGGGASSDLPLIYKGPGQVDQRLSQNQDLSVVKGFAQASDPARPLRPGYGTVGNPITVRANFFALKLPKNPIYDYNVEFTPKTDINRLKMRIFTLLEETPECQQFLSHIAHDKSSRLVSAKPLPQPLNISVPFYEEGASRPKPKDTVYTVSITLARKLEPNEITQSVLSAYFPCSALTQHHRYMEGQVQYRDYDPLPLISALNLVLQQYTSRNGVRVGKNKYFFPTSSEGFSLSPGIRAFQGFYTSVRPTFKQLMVNV